MIKPRPTSEAGIGHNQPPAVIGDNWYEPFDAQLGQLTARMAGAMASLSAAMYEGERARTARELVELISSGRIQHIRIEY